VAVGRCEPQPGRGRSYKLVRSFGCPAVVGGRPQAPYVQQAEHDFGDGAIGHGKSGEAGASGWGVPRVDPRNEVETRGGVRAPFDGALTVRPAIYGGLRGRKTFIG